MDEVADNDKHIVNVKDYIDLNKLLMRGQCNIQYNSNSVPK